MCVCCLSLSSSSFGWRVSFVAHRNRKQTSRAEATKPPQVGKLVIVLHYNTCFQGFQRLFALVLSGSRLLRLLSSFFLLAHQPSQGEALAASLSLSSLFFLIYHGLENQIINFCEIEGQRGSLVSNFYECLCYKYSIVSLYLVMFSCLIIDF